MKKLIVAKSGVNAETATDPNDFIFHSDYNTFKIIFEDSVTVALGTTGAEGEIYSFTKTQPDNFAFAFCKFSDGKVAPPGTKAANGDFWFTKFYVDENCNFEYVNLTGGSYTVTFKYILCELPL